jgi:hypothetical protein
MQAIGDTDLRVMWRFPECREDRVRDAFAKVDVGEISVATEMIKSFPLAFRLSGRWCDYSRSLKALASLASRLSTSYFEGVSFDSIVQFLDGVLDIGHA